MKASCQVQKYLICGEKVDIYGDWREYMGGVLLKEGDKGMKQTNKRKAESVFQPGHPGGCTPGNSVKYLRFFCAADI